MRLSELFSGVDYQTIGCSPTDEFNGKLSHDSRNITVGDMFFCLVGTQTNGNDYICDAVLYGAAFAVTEGEYYVGIPTIVVSDVRRCMCHAARNYYGCPDKYMTIIAVTGTNGKTTTANYIQHILRSEYKCGICGTMGYFMDGECFGEGLTTPDPIDLFRILQQMRERGAEAVVMEISAHAAYLQKVCALKIDYLVYTNLSRDHLDFFGNMEAYREAKRSLLMRKDIDNLVLNLDDELAREVYRLREKNCYAVALNNPAEVFPVVWSEIEGGIRAVLSLFDDMVEVTTRIHGRFNIYNLLSAVTVAYLMGMELEQIKSRTESIEEVAGRYNIRIHGGTKYIVDYAHTPDGLQKLLENVSQETTGRVITVFGCGGNRDRGKRAIMGAIATRLSSVTIITSDNPRFEQPEQIIADIVTGVMSGACFEIQPNRENAIRRAVDMSTEGDTVVIAGKGAEKYQQIMDRYLPFNDMDILTHAIEEKSAND